MRLVELRGLVKDMRALDAADAARSSMGMVAPEMVLVLGLRRGDGGLIDGKGVVEVELRAMDVENLLRMVLRTVRERLEAQGVTEVPVEQP